MYRVRKCNKQIVFVYNYAQYNVILLNFIVSYFSTVNKVGFIQRKV